MPAIRWLARLALVALVVQVALGGWVSANYAVLACNDFPTCQGVWWPPMDFSQGFDPWRHLGQGSDGGTLSLAALTSIQWVHRHFAVVVVVLLGTLAVSCWRSRALARPGAVLGVLLIAQASTGIVSVVFAWPPLSCRSGRPVRFAWMVRAITQPPAPSGHRNPSCRRSWTLPSAESLPSTTR